MRSLRFIGVYLVLVFMVFGFWGTASATDIRSRQSVNIPADQSVHDEMLTAAGELKIDGNINNDLMGVASNATINGRVGGDILLAAGTINLSGEAAEDARLAGGTIRITGTVKRNLIAVGGSIEIADTAVIYGDILVYGGTLKLYGTVKGDLRFSGGSVLIAGNAEANVNINSPEITIANTTHIAGDLNYTSTNAATIQNGAKIDGKSTYKLSQKQDYFAQKSIGSLVISSIAYLVLALLLIVFLPNRVLGIAEIYRRQLWPALGIGILGLVILPLLVLFLLVTVIGAPTAVVLLALYLLVLYLAKTFVAVKIGQLIMGQLEKKKEPNLVISVLIGLVIIIALTNLPYIGYFVSLLVSVLGLGAIIIYLYNLRRAAKAFKLI